MGPQPPPPPLPPSPTTQLSTTTTTTTTTTNTTFTTTTHHHICHLVVINRNCFRDHCPCRFIIYVSFSFVVFSINVFSSSSSFSLLFRHFFFHFFSLELRRFASSSPFCFVE